MTEIADGVGELHMAVCRRFGGSAGVAISAHRIAASIRAGEASPDPHPADELGELEGRCATRTTSASALLRERLGVQGVTTHSFRKTVATLIDDEGLAGLLDRTRSDE